MRVPVADRLLAVVGYLPFLFWVPVMLKRDSMFAQFHGRQSGVLWGLWITPIVLVFGVFLFLPDTAQRSLSAFFFGAAMALTAIYLVMVLVGILKAMLRERYRMPLVADLALKMGL
jgi:uncharacterized membrane protein